MNAHETDVRFSVLGPVRAWRGTEELALGSPQQRAVLAALLLRRSRPVALDELVDAVWGGDPPPAAVSVLRTYVSRLRKVLEPGRASAAPPRTVVSVGDSYLAQVPEESLDLAVFERHAAEARRLRTAGEVSAAAKLLHSALDLWRGSALAGLPGPLAESERGRLDEVRLTTLETRLDIDIELGRHTEVIAELTALVALHPLREHLSRLLMLALYRSGRQAEALTAYRTARNAVVGELGIEPSARLQDLHERILAGDPALARDPSGQREPDATSSVPESVPAQLPPGLATFTGRTVELDRLRALLPEDDGQFTTVVISAIGGMAGVGKTALAVRWAHELADRFPGGQLYINLRGFGPTGSAVQPEDAVRTFLDALGVPAMRIPSGLDAKVALYRSLLAGRRVLVLLDNARDTDQVRPLLPGSLGSLVIVTSRNQLLGLVAAEGAHPLTLDQLTSAEAHALLAGRLGADRPAAEPEATAEIITRCAHLPLALAIVAAHAATHPGFPLGSLAESLRESHGSLDAFAGGDDLSTDVRAVFSWSYRALSAPAARLFRLLGLHSGPDISALAAAALAGLTPREIRGPLAELTSACLVTERAPGRYTLHDLLQVYAAERVDAEETPQERDRAVGRLLTWYLHAADAAYAQITPHRERIPLPPLPPAFSVPGFTTHDQALDWCETERANLVTGVHQAAAIGRADIAWRLPATLWGFFYLRSHLHDWADTTRVGLAAARAAHDLPGEARALADTAAALRSSGRYEEAIGHLRRAMAAYRELGDATGRSLAVSNLGDVYLQSGRLRKAVEYIRRGLVLDEINGSAWGKGIALSNLGDAYQRLGRYDDAVGCLDEALTVLRANGNRWVVGVTLDILGTVHHRLHRYDEAVGYYHQALETHRAVANRWGEGHTLSNLGDVHRAAGEHAAARASWRQALAVFETFDHPDADGVRERLARPENGRAGTGAPADASA